MEFKSDMFFFSNICNFPSIEEDAHESVENDLQDKYNLDKKIRRNRKLFLEKRRPNLERDHYKEFPKEKVGTKFHDKKGLD